MATSPFMVPMTNNAGTNGMGGGGTPTTMSGGNFNFGNTANPNPTVPNANPYGSAVSNTFQLPTTPVVQNPTGSPGVQTGQSLNPTRTNPQGETGLFGSTLAQENSQDSSLSATFGGGIGDLLSQYLASEGGFNSPLTTQTVNAQTAAMQQQIQQGLGNLQTNLAESGISPNSSVSALETSNYMSNATTQENAITAEDFFNMWSQSQGNELNILDLTGGAGAAKKAGQSAFFPNLVNTLITAAGNAA